MLLVLLQKSFKNQQTPWHDLQDSDSICTNVEYQSRKNDWHSKDVYAEEHLKMPRVLRRSGTEGTLSMQALSPEEWNFSI